MESNKNLSGNSGVLAYEIGDNSITVQFQDESVYVFNYASAGEENIEKMKELAVAGEGLDGLPGKPWMHCQGRGDSYKDRLIKAHLGQKEFPILGSG